MPKTIPKVAFIFMPTVRRLAPHVGGKYCWFEFSDRGLLPRPYVEIGVSAGAAAAASCLPPTHYNLRKAAEIYANLKPNDIVSWPWPIKIFAGLTVVSTLFPLANLIFKNRIEHLGDGHSVKKIGLTLGETLFSWLSIAGLNYFFWTQEAVTDNDRLRKLFLKNLDSRGIFNCDILFEALTTDVVTGEEVIFTNYRDEDKDPHRFVEAILASAAIVGSLPPSKIDGRFLSDGGVLSRIPLHRALAHNVDAIVVFRYQSTFEEQRGPFSWPKGLVRASEISETKGVAQLIKENYELRQRLGENLPPIFWLNIVDPDVKLPDIDLKNFSPDDMVEGMNIGYQTVKDNLPQLQEFFANLSQNPKQP